MTQLEQFILEYETEEDANDMHFSTYFIPAYYNEEEPS
jgi:hypothetical protein